MNILRKQKLTFVSVIIILLIGIMLSYTSTITAEEEVLQGVATDAPTNIYADTSQGSSTLKSYSKGSILYFEKHSSNWYSASVYVNGSMKDGYIYAGDVEEATQEPALQQGVALKNKTKIFSKASTSSNSLKSYNKGSVLYYEKFTSNWFSAEVYRNGEWQTGYISANHVETATNEPQNMKGIAQKSNTKVFSSPNTNASALKSYNEGHILHFESYTSNWYRAEVYKNGRFVTGYIHNNHIDKLYEDSTELKGVALDDTTVYADPSTSSNGLRSYSEGSILHYESFSSQWHTAEIWKNGQWQTVYILKNKLDNIVDEQKLLNGIAINGNTNTYSKPTTNSAAVKTYKEGSVLYYESFSQEWYEAINFVNGNKKKVYIKTDQVENATDNQKSLNAIALKSPTKAYSRASQNSKAWRTYSKNSSLRVKSFTENWYEAEVYHSGKWRKAYFHREDINTDILYETTNYNIDFNNMVDIQMRRSPKSDGRGRIDASREEVEYYANPSNYERGTDEYLQFLVLSQPTGARASELNSKILYNKGTLANTGSSFIQGANTYNINELYLIAHALHETGNGGSELAQGIEHNGKTVYNMYGIGAYDDCAKNCGAKRAYEEGWFTPEQAIIGGAKFIGENYVNDGQDTLYKMRWNPANPGVHQYATHVQWAELQTALISDYYDMLDNFVQIYDVPKFVNQPGSTTEPSGGSEPSQPSDSPDGSVEVYDYPKGVVGITDTGNTGLNFRDQPNGDRIGGIPNGSEISVLGHNGGNWLNVKYDGQEGWVHGDYVNIINLIQVQEGQTVNIRKKPAGDDTGDNVTEGKFYVVETNSNQNIIEKEADLNDTNYTWVNINYGNGKTGWIANDFVNYIK
ncbi:SH3 domain-containing protein [Alkalibacillus sp. S2W]|uniref:SH3 domain-containing protein n=1 Tax=Alkalibacillus sp. S2W TaxID=3386553 RepID=UPI00398D1151